MEFKGRLIKTLNERSGQGKSGEWKSLDLVLQTEGEHQETAVFQAGTKVFDYAKNAKIGDMITVSFNFRANEYKENWYNRLDAWKIVVEAQGGEQAFGMNNSTNPDSDLPF